MPYKNIFWIKLNLELLSDYRFTDQLNDSEKLVFISLLVLAGSTKNQIPEDPTYIKRRINLQLSLEEIKSAVNRIKSVYPKTIVDNGVISFKNFDKNHNFIGGKSHSEEVGNPEAKSREAIDKRREDKNREDKSNSRFAPPSIETIREYCKERNNDVNPETFFNFYQSKGWLVGKSPMKDWQACVRTWENKNQPKKADWNTL